MDNNFEIEIKKQNIDDKQEVAIRDAYGLFYAEAAGWKEKADALIVTHESQIKEIALASESRKALKAIRCSVETRRKELVLRSNRYNKAVNGMSNFVKNLIEPIEKHLEEQENFVNIQKENKMKAIEVERTAELEKYDVDVSLYNLRGFNDEQFNAVLTESKNIYRMKKEEEKRLIFEENAKAEADRIENERIRKENATLKAEREAIAAKLKAKNDADEAIKAKEEAAERAAREGKHKNEIAPDRDKLMSFAGELAGLSFPVVSDPKAIKIIDDSVVLLRDVVAFIKNNASEL